MGALTAHPRLRLLDLLGNRPRDGGMEATGAALAALLLADAPALQALDIRYCRLGDAGLSPVLEALRHNTHLTALHCCGNDMSEVFARNTLLPSVRANTSLRELVAAEEEEEEEEDDFDDEVDRDVAAACEAEALVAARAQPE
jgi:hypothetical protein